ncbi:MAG: hypothetical protein HY288_12885 [Planctomycetia bacterium]|nr:hypothetical protein [Planctomycetia bacterium]
MPTRWLAALILLTPSAVLAAETSKRTWNFDGETTGQIAKGFTNEVGSWSVVEIGQGKALAQAAKNANPVFNIALVRDASAKDVDISVEMKAVAGETDQGGGIVWRAKDAKNYYLARYNPLEDNYRLYRVVGGKRTLLQNADIAHSDGVHALRVTMNGDRIECYYDGKKYLDQKDATFTEPGRIGLWTKADAQSQFDNLTLVGK